VDMGGNADKGAGAAAVVVNGLLGAAVDIGGNANDDVGAETVVVNGLFGGAVDIGGNAELEGAGASVFAVELPKLKPVVVGA